VNQTRRQLITGVSVAGAGLLLVGCYKDRAVQSVSTANKNKADEQSSDEAASEISAVEDLMREHGILRRALLVFQESATKLRQDPNSIPPDALEKAAQLFQAFGEDYHEKRLEEEYILPAVKKTQNAASPYADILLAQHNRGREITSYILASTKGDKIPTANMPSFITALETFVRMYEHHAAIEDTIVFPAWKEVIGAKEMDELAVKFEEIEEEIFGEDGFEAAATRMNEIEQSLGLDKLEMFTAPPPPSHS
jgi:hemerythrin-like domain-containing protein